MGCVVDEDFTDWDGKIVPKGTTAQKPVRMGTDGKGRRFYNLISNGSVLSVCSGMPPVKSDGVEDEQA